MIIFLLLVVIFLLFIISRLCYLVRYERANKWFTVGGPTYNQHGDELKRKDGLWYFDAHDMSDDILTDTKGIYIAPDYDLTGLSGAWVKEDYYK